MRSSSSNPKSRFSLIVLCLAGVAGAGRAQEPGSTEWKAMEEKAREARQERLEERLAKQYGDQLPGLLDRAASHRLRERRAEVQELQRRRLAGLGAAAPAWTFLGPTVRTHRLPNVPSDDSGLAASIAFSAADPKVLFVASVGGGVWKSTDGGLAWRLVTGDIPALQFGAVAVAPSDAKRVYAGAGSADASTFRLGNARSTGYQLRVGFGMIRSTDGGDTWSQLPREGRPADFFWDILVDPQNPDVLLVAGDRGVQRSTDGGSTWTQVLGGEAQPWATKLSRPTATPSVVYASTWGPKIAGSIWKSTDGGVTWSEKVNGLPGDAETRSRVTVAVAPSNANRVYALIDSYGTQLDGARSDDGGDTWTALKLAEKKPTNETSPAGTSIDILKSQGNFCNVLGVDKDNPDVVFGAGTDAFRSTDGGATWAWITDWRGSDPKRAYVHADFHEFVQLPDGTILFGTDGGVFATTDAGATFRPLNRTMQTFLATGICANPRNLDQIAMGAQDNGNSIRVQGTEWRETTTGDGFACLFHPTSADTQYVSTQTLNVMRSTDGGVTFQRIREGLKDAGTAQAPFGTNLLSSVSGGTFRLYTFSRRKLWLTTDSGDSWAEASENLPLSANIGDLTISPSDPSRMALVDFRRNIFVSTDAGANWTTTGEVPAPVFETARIRIDRTDPSRIFVSSDSPRAEQQRLWMSADNGATWTAISRTGEANGLPDVPINSFAVDPVASGVYWAGTFIGLYRSGDGGQTWRRHGEGLPNVPVMVMAFTPDGKALRVGTHGRGVWEIGTDPGTATSAAAVLDLSNPQAAFSFTPASPRPGESVEFVDESTGAPSAWSWTFETGATSTKPSPSHVFAAAGTYPVALEITTAKGTFKVTKPLTVSKPSTGTGAALTYFLPIVLTASGQGGTRYSTELTLTNQSGKDASLTFTAKGSAGGTAFESSASYTMKPGQEVKPDVWAFLKSLGMAVPDGDPLASLRVAASGPDDIADFGAQVRVTTPPNEALAAQGIKGSFGLAYAATPLTRGASREAVLYGLQQTGSTTGTRSNVACAHAGGSTGNVSLEVTYYDGTTRKAHPSKDATSFASLTPFEWRQVGRPLESRGIQTGYAVVRKTAGDGQFVCYAVLNDNVNGDGSFVPMFVNDQQTEVSDAFVPVILEASGYQSEVTLANRSHAKMTVYLTLVLSSRPNDPEFAAVDLEAGEQVVVDNVVKWLRDAGLNVPEGSVGSLFVHFEQWADPEGADPGDRPVSVNLGYVGVRTFSTKADGRFGLAYGSLPQGLGADSAAFIFGLQQNGERGKTEGTRSNLAVINSAGVDEDDIEVEITYFGPDGKELGKQSDCSPCRLRSGEWKQFNSVLDGRNGFSAPHAYAQVVRKSGTDQFYAYGILNDQLNDDGSFVPMTLP